MSEYTESTESTEPTEPTAEETKVDYLAVDVSIPGQNYVCLSFLSPESLIQNKEAFKCAKFLQSYCKDKKLNFDEVYNSYNDFTYKHEEKLQRDFDEKNDFQTSMRGLKVRGVFDTRGAAEDKAKKLSISDSSFHTFIGQVGYWLPWDPNADKVGNEVFQNAQLNEMMEKYEENNISRDIFYEEQKRDKMRGAVEDLAKSKAEKAAQEKAAQEKADAIENCPTDEVSSSLSPTCQSDLDPELVLDEGVDNLPEDGQNIGFSPTTSKSPVEAAETVESSETVESPETVETGSQVSDDIKSGLEGSDPWMQQKGSK